MTASRCTTTSSVGKFRVEDITFRQARKQSEVENEIDRDEETEEVIKAPISVTPEQVIEFFKTKIAKASDSNEKRLYSQTIKWIKELQTTKKELTALREKMIAREEEDKELDDIVAEDI